MINIFKIFKTLIGLDQDFFTFWGGGSSGGSGGGGTTTSTSTTTNLPEYAKPFYEELLKQSGLSVYRTGATGDVIGVQEYKPYTGQRVAGFTPAQQAVQTQVAGMTDPTQFAQAQQGLTGVGQIAGAGTTAGLSQAFGYQPGAITPQQVSTGTFGTAQAQQYMNPYMQAVVDIEKREAQRQANLAKSAGAMGAIGRGTFGGARQALIQSEADRNLQQQLADIQSRGGQTAFNQALQAFQADQARGLTAQQANQAAALQAAQLGQQGQQFAAGLGRDIGLAGLQTGLQGAQAMGALGATQQATALDRLKSQAASAAEQQALNQEQANVAYQQFREAQEYPLRLLEYQSNILRGNAGALGSTQVAYAPAPSLASQLGGLGLAGLGLYNILGKA